MQTLQIACQQLGSNATILLGSPFRDDSHFVALGQATATDGSNMYSQILNLLQEPAYEEVNSCLDGAGIHSYLTTIEATETITGLTTRGLFTKPFWITEAGVGAQGPNSRRTAVSNENKDVSDEQQADYMLQFFVLTKQAFKQIGMLDETGRIMYHRLRDETSGHESTYGLLNNANGPWPAYYAVWMTSQLLGDGSFDSEQACTGCKHLIFKDRNNTFIHVLWAANDSPSPVTVTAVDQLATHVLRYDRRFGESYYSKNGKPVSLNLVSHAVTINDLQPASQIAGSYRIGSETIILIEYRTTVDKTSPTIGAALLYDNDNMCSAATQTLIQGYDGESGMKDVTVVASPPTTYDLSWTVPGKLYSTKLPVAPPVGATWYYTVTDKAGNMTTGSITNDGAPNCGGGDHPDDNYSSASLPSLPAAST